jgi:hypothetical protein
MATAGSVVTDLLVAAARRETERHEAAVTAAKTAWRRVVDDPELGDASQEAADAWMVVEAAEEPFRDAAWEEKEVLDREWAADGAVLAAGLTLREYEELRRVWETRVARLTRLVTLYDLLGYTESAAVRRCDLGVARGELALIVEYVEARHAETAATWELIRLREADEASSARPPPNWAARVETAKREAEARDRWWTNRLHAAGLTPEERLKVIELERAHAMSAHMTSSSASGSERAHAMGAHAQVRTALAGEAGIMASRDERVLDLLRAVGL